MNFLSLFSRLSSNRRGNLKKALDLFYKMRSSGLKLGVVEYNVLMATVGKTENKRLLGGIMADMQEKNIDPNRYTYATMIKSYGEGRKFRLARDTFKEMRMKRLADTTAYNIMIRVCLARTMSREHDALEYLKEMAREGIPPDVVTYTTFIEHYGHMKDAEQAVHFFKEMEAAEIKADVVAYTALIGSLYKANECGKAIAYFHRMKRRGVRRRWIRLRFLSLHSGTFVTVSRVNLDLTYLPFFAEQSKDIAELIHLHDGHLGAL